MRRNLWQPVKRTDALRPGTQQLIYHDFWDHGVSLLLQHFDLQTKRGEIKTTLYVDEVLKYCPKY